jgi:hypothetical protein
MGIYVVVKMSAMKVLLVMERVHAMIQYNCTGMGARVFKVSKNTFFIDKIFRKQ